MKQAIIVGGFDSKYSVMVDNYYMIEDVSYEEAIKRMELVNYILDLARKSLKDFR